METQRLNLPSIAARRALRPTFDYALVLLTAVLYYAIGYYWIHQAVSR